MLIRQILLIIFGLLRDIHMSIVIYTNKFIRKEWVASNRFPFILIRPKWKGVAFVLEHEKVHSRQMIRTFFLHGLMYKFSKKYRLKAEVEAYKVSIEYGQELDDCAWAISNVYNLEVTEKEARVLLTSNN